MRYSLRRRNLLIALAVTFVLTLAYSAQKVVEFEQNLRLLYADELFEDLPQLSEELANHGIASLPTVKKRQYQTEYIALACLDHGGVAWASQRAKAKGLTQLCAPHDEFVPSQRTELTNGDAVIVYNIDTTIDNRPAHIIFARDARDFDHAINRQIRRAVLRVVIVLIIAGILFALAFRISLRPLDRFRAQLAELSEGKRRYMDEDIAEELTGIATAINELLEQGSSRQQRYQNAMNDLAHGLKTRLAACNALLDNPQHDQALRIQLAQMDSLVQYQLRRGLSGRIGLNRSGPEVLPVLKPLVTMVERLYQDKHLDINVTLEQKLTFPGTRGELLELMGNLLENAGKYCLEHIDIEAGIATGMFWLTVADDGPGIPEAKRDSVLQRGFRADQIQPGLGIGLSVCADIVANLRGNIMISDSQRGGALLRVEIPLPTLAQHR